MTQTKWVTKYTTKKVWVKTNYAEDWTLVQAANSKYNMTAMVSTTDSQTRFTLSPKLSMPLENLEMPYAYASAEVTPNVAQTLDMVVPNSNAHFVLQLSEIVDSATQVLVSVNIVPTIDAHQNIKLSFIPTTNNVTATLTATNTGLIWGVAEIGFGYWKTIAVPYLEQEQVLVTLCDSVDDKYRFGFNGMEKDNELKGLGNSLDFGARMYDSRLGRFLTLDPFMGVYPSESNYTFAGNSPLLFIDKNGDKKFIYKYVIDLRNQTITTPTHAVVKDGLTSVHRRIYNSAKEYWSWYDYSINQITIIDKDGKEKTYESAPFNVNYSKERAWTALPSETMARAAVGEYWTDYFQPEKEYPGETYGGYSFVFRGDTKGITNFGADNKYNRTGNATTQIIYIDDLLSVLGVGGSAGTVNKPANAIELFKYVNDVAQTATNAQELAPIKVKKKFLQCETCERYQYESDRSNIDDTLNKGITTENTQQIETRKFHE